MKKGKSNNNLFLILVILASAFYYKETILKFISRGKDVKDLSGIIKSEQYVKVVKVRGTVKKVQNDVDFYPLKEGDGLEVGDSIKTSKTSIVIISFGTQLQNQFTLGPSSDLGIDSLFSNDKGVRTGTAFTLERGLITSELNQLEGVEYKIDTGKAVYSARESKFHLSKMKNGDDLLIVKNGIVEQVSLVGKKKPKISEKGIYFFFKDDSNISVSDPATTEKIQAVIDKEENYQEETLYNIHSIILGRIDKVKIISTIKDRLIKIKRALLKQVKLNDSKIDKAPLQIVKLKEKFKVAEKKANEDIKCLNLQGKCILKSEAVLLERGIVMTSGRKKYNQESIKILRSYILGFSQKIEKNESYVKKLRSFVTKQRVWIGEIEEIEKNIYPELGTVKPKYIDKMVSMNKVLKDKPLKRFMEMAKWIAVIEVLE